MKIDSFEDGHVCRQLARLERKMSEDIALILHVLQPQSSPSSPPPPPPRNADMEGPLTPLDYLSMTHEGFPPPPCLQQVNKKRIYFMCVQSVIDLEQVLIRFNSC